MADERDGAKEQLHRYEEPTFRQHHWPPRVWEQGVDPLVGIYVPDDEDTWSEPKPSAVEQLAQAVLDGRVTLLPDKESGVYRVNVYVPPTYQERAEQILAEVEKKFPSA